MVVAPNVAGTKRVAEWRDMLERAIGFDSWGQVVEAVEEYERLSKSVKKTVEANDGQFPEEALRWIQKLGAVAKIRSQTAEDLSGDVTLLQLREVKDVQAALQDFDPQAPVPEFPVFVAEIKKQLDALPAPKPSPPKVSARSILEGSDDEDDEDLDAGSATRGGGSLLPKKVFHSGTSVMVRIEKIKLKDPLQYIEPFVTLSVKDVNGVDLTAPQDTPVTKSRDEFIHFNQDVHLQLPLEQLPEGCAVFFEFKHYKPKKRKISTKCWCFLELDELKNGKVPLELYAKPTDFKRKKLHLLTEKAHYLYTSIHLTED
eukprot:m.481752 g.481752  ORF g.481752 m.481752 type:complete len:315 (+) comp22309_c0_seq1:207-1151(+)